MSRLVFILVISVLATASFAHAQSSTTPTSPIDPVERLITSGATAAPNVETTPAVPRRSTAVNALDDAIAMGKALRGAEETGMLRGVAAGRSRALTRGLQAARVAAVTADRPNEYVAALVTARQRIADLAGSVPSCPKDAEDKTAPSVAVPSGWTLSAAASWLQQLATSYCTLAAQLQATAPAAADADTSTRAASFLPFAGLTGGRTTPQASAQLADLYFTHRWRLYMRSTFQAKKAETPAEAEDQTSDGDAADAAAKVDDKVRNAMLDPFGGDLNLMAGYYRKVPTPFLEGDANDAEHGLFFDARAGLKLIELPEQTLTLNEGPSSITPFHAASVALRLRLPTYFDRLVQKRAGAVELAAVFASTGIVDRSASALFTRSGDTVPLPRQVRVLHVSLGVDITDVVQLGLSGNVWSNTGLKKRVAVEFNVTPTKKK